MCLFNPTLSWNLSFQLSFGTTLRLVLYADPLQKILIRPCRAGSAWTVTIGCPSRLTAAGSGSKARPGETISLDNQLHAGTLHKPLTKMMKKYSALIITALTAVGGIFFFFSRMGMNDAQVLADFPAAYKNYDHAISDFSKALLTANPQSAPEPDVLKLKVDEALVELNTKASVRVSSLTKNDGDLMRIMREIADLSAKEFNTLKAVQSALVDRKADADPLAKEFADFTNQRQAAYARFRELAGRKE